MILGFEVRLLPVSGGWLIATMIILEWRLVIFDFRSSEINNQQSYIPSQNPRGFLSSIEAWRNFKFGWQVNPYGRGRANICSLGMI